MWARRFKEQRRDRRIAIQKKVRGVVVQGAEGVLCIQQCKPEEVAILESREKSTVYWPMLMGYVPSSAVTTMVSHMVRGDPRLFIVMCLNDMGNCMGQTIERYNGWTQRVAMEEYWGLTTWRESSDPQWDQEMGRVPLRVARLAEQYCRCTGKWKEARLGRTHEDGHVEVPYLRPRRNEDMWWGLVDRQGDRVREEWRGVITRPRVTIMAAMGKGEGDWMPDGMMKVRMGVWFVVLGVHGMDVSMAPNMEKVKEWIGLA
jgi:hypothetical protein